MKNRKLARERSSRTGLAASVFGENRRVSRRFSSSTDSRRQQEQVRTTSNDCHDFFSREIHHFAPPVFARDHQRAALFALAKVT